MTQPIATKKIVRGGGGGGGGGWKKLMLKHLGAIFTK